MFLAQLDPGSPQFFLGLVALQVLTGALLLRVGLRWLHKANAPPESPARNAPEAHNPLVFVPAPASAEINFGYAAFIELLALLAFIAPGAALGGLVALLNLGIGFWGAFLLVTVLLLPIHFFVRSVILAAMLRLPMSRALVLTVLECTLNFAALCVFGLITMVVVIAVP
jgi:hypothetical protein